MTRDNNEPSSFAFKTPFDATAVLESIGDACYILDNEWCFLYLNANAERIVRRPREELLGKRIWDEFPEVEEAGSGLQYRRAVAERVTVTVEEFYPPLDTWFDVKAFPFEGGLAVFFQNVDVRKRAEGELREANARLRDAQVRLEAALSAGGIATWTYDLTSDRVVADAGLASLFSVSAEDAAGGKLEVYLQAIHPDDRFQVAEAIGDAVAHKDVYEAEYRVVLPDESLRWLATRGRVERSASGQAISLPGVVLDITEQIGRRERERFLTGLVERTRVFADPEDVIAEAVNSVGKFLGVSRCIFADIDIEADTCTIRPDYRADPLSPSIEGIVSIASFGPYVVSEYAARRAVVVDDTHDDPIKAPPESVAAYDAIGIRAHVTVPVIHTGNVVSCMSVHNATPRHWEAEEIELLRSVVERTWLTVEVLRQQRALAREAEERHEAHARTERVLDSLTDAFFTLDRDFQFTFVNRKAESMWNMTRAELMGRSAWEVFPDSVGGVFYHEYHRVMEGGLPESVEDFYPLLDAWLEVRAYPSDDGISVFFQDVTERKSLDIERERLLAEQQSRAEREALLNRIGQAIRSASDPEAVQEAAVELLGDALGADRCYFALYDLGQGIVTITHDWHGAELPSVQGVYPFENTVEMFRELYGDANTSVVEDAHTANLSAQTRINMERLRLRSRVSVALVEGDSLMATLTAAMAGGPREWTQDEVTLVEAVGTLLRTAVEAARVAQREHNIATQLQSALQPDLPERVHDLAVGRFTRPALDEAQVGGDFFDIFPLDKELYAIVIGDVSGKGLAAAQQIALIRNSLRTALYLYRATAQAAIAISTIVSAHDLLVGFVTAWIGVYDAATGQITYCSCGHEPGLIRRSSGRVEALETTGPPLGVSENAEYGDQTVMLSSGDRLLLYTDGISEAGPNRREMLGTEGLIRLFGSLPVGLGAQAEAEALVEEVSSYTNGVFRDDVAVLLARRE